MMTEQAPPGHREGLSEPQRALLEKRLRGVHDMGAERRRIPRCDRSKPLPLSFGQQMLWFLDQFASGSPLYNLPAALRLRGVLDGEALRRALGGIVARHEALRTRLVAEDGTPLQVIDARSEVDLPVVDLAGVPATKREAALADRMSVEAGRPFDLSRDLMLRATLFRLACDDHALLLTMHHAASDGWSLNVLLRELKAFYESFANGGAAVFPGLPVQYADFALWQRGMVQGEALEKLLAYWRPQLAGANDTLELPLDRPATPAPSAWPHVGNESVALDSRLVGALKDLGRSQGVTLFISLLAAFKTLLHRYSQQTDILTGAPVAGRTHSDTEGLIGFFVNTLVLRDDLSENPAFSELLQRVRETTLAALTHQELPFGKLVEELRPARMAGRTPLVPVMFAFQSATVQPFRLGGVEATPMPVAGTAAKFDLTLSLEEHPGGLVAGIEYNGDIFDAPTIRRMLGHYVTILGGVAANHAARLRSLPLLTPEERRRVLVDWNRTQTDYPGHRTVHRLFEEQAASSPDAVALELHDRRLTYRELNNRANALAGRLVALGVGGNSLVGVCMERSVETIVALVAILKCGSAYVSLDATYPKERLALMIEEVRPPVILTQPRLAARLPEHRAEVLLLDKGALAGAPACENPSSGATADSLAYVSFTSGSTGRPKGVCVPHRAVVRLVRNANYARFAPDEVFLQLAPIAFDASTLEIWGPLLNGARLIICPPQNPSVSELGDLLQRHGVTTLWLTSGLFQQVIEARPDCLRHVRQLLAGGDVLPVPQVRKALEVLPHCQLINGYGPTENTTFTCCHRVTKESLRRGSVPIGRPVSNTQVYVLDEEMQPVPAGVPGELYAGGDGVAIGYLNRPELTAERFIPNPFTRDASARLYRTGDLVRYLPDGTIEFIGRSDGQVKVRGFRVETGEVETALAQHPALKECAVVTRSDGATGNRLFAYVVAREGFPADEACLRTFLLAKLPDYMVPSAFVRVPALPLSPNGKLDRKALPAPEPGGSGRMTPRMEPRDDLERRLARIWEEILNTSPIGVTDRFFELGGHSLLAVRLVARIEKEFSRRLPLAAVFQGPTIEQMALLLRDDAPVSPVADSSIVGIQPRGGRTPLFLVHGVGGGMFWGYANLARCLGAGQPVFAFKSRGLDGREELESIEAMAAHYVAELKSFRPHGPYLLGGYCFGGNVAYEMARQLQEQGVKVAGLILLNCAPPNSSYMKVRPTPAWAGKFIRNLGRTAVSFLHWSPAHRREYARWRWRSLKAALRRVFTANRGGATVPTVEEAVNLSACPAAQRSLWEAHIRALFRYRPKPYASRLSLFRSRNHPLLSSFDEHYGWDEFAGSVMVRVVPGEHESILEEPHVIELAAALQRLLEELEPQGKGDAAS